MTQIDRRACKATPRKSPLDDYQRKARHIQSVAAVHSDEVRRELARIACLYERLANQLTKSARYVG
jgi:hypothetical protein